MLPLTFACRATIPSELAGWVGFPAVAHQIEYRTLSLVLIGKFNPAIFSPGWLSKMGVISDEAFEAAVIQVIHPEIAKFSVGPHLFDVIPGRFILQTESEPFAQLLDMAVQIFCDCLPHTPINMMGINLDSHFNTRSQAQRTAFGRAFAPLAPWGDFGKRIEAQPANDPGGVIILTMREGNLPDRPHGYRQVTLEASRKLDQNTGVRVLLNDHYETRTESNIAGAEEIMTILKDRFDASLAESKAIVDAVMEHSKGLPA